jgi:hypothetical protein
VPTVLVDTGYFLADERGQHDRLRPDIAVKDDWVAKAYDQFPVDIINLSSHDLRYLSNLLSKSELARRAKSQPLLNRLVSANTSSVSPNVVAPAAFIIRELSSRSAGATKQRPVRVAFIGLTETIPAPPDGFKFITPAEAASRTLPEARKKADLVIMLARVNNEDAVRLAREAPGADVIIAGGPTIEEAFTPPLYVGQTLIVFTPFETRMLGELRFYRNPQGKFSTKQRFISLDELIPSDPAAQKLVAEASSAEIEARDKSKQLWEAWLAKSVSGNFGKLPANDSSKNGSPAYVSAAVCTQCHATQYAKWTNSAHAHAINSLASRSAEFEASCLDCHATGSLPGRGAGSSEMARLQNVQCEQCHGPGSEHAAKPGKGYGRIINLQSACTSCHTSETSPGFDLQAAWAKIKH